MRTAVGLGLALVVGLCLAPALVPSAAARVLAGPAGAVPAIREGGAAAPVFAYYYIWYTPASWARAKQDLPLLGTYDSKDPSIISQHVTWAKESGIDGFIVSWKHETRLDVPLRTLIAEAHRQGFELILLYESLDVNREPIGASKVAADLEWFEQAYGSDSAFDVFGPPTVIWSGSWKYTPQEIASVRTAIGAPQRVLLLGSERSAADYTARHALFDGDAYYWSSADPIETPGFQKRLADLSAAVEAYGGKWIAPVAPGFDARLVGGTSVVPRRDGATYRSFWSAAEALHPSAMGIISWNEFSENSHIEPSEANKFTYLDITGQLTGHPIASPQVSTLPGPVEVPPGGIPDSSDGGSTGGPIEQLLSVLVGLALLAGIAVSGLRARGRIEGA